jgi:hypothetical protein
MGNKWILLIDKTPSKIGLFLVVFKLFLKKTCKIFYKNYKKLNLSISLSLPKETVNYQYLDLKNKIKLLSF